MSQLMPITSNVNNNDNRLTEVETKKVEPNEDEDKSSRSSLTLPNINEPKFSIIQCGLDYFA